MANGQLHTLIRHIRKLVEPDGIGSLSDAQLLERFLNHRDEAAFEVLVWRHGAMVLSLCRRLLRHEQDAEDAFQATFLVLVRRASSIGKREALGNWLYTVAFRIALEIRARSKVQVIDPNHFANVPAAETSDLLWRDLRPILDEEVARLPDKYRAAFVLCYLEGKTNEEAAKALGCPKGTVLSRLSRARERLRSRLTRRGLAFSAGLLATVVSEQARSATLPAVLVDKSIKAALTVAAGKAATAVVSLQVAALTEGVLRAMFWTKLKVALAILLVVSAAGLGGGALTNWAAGENQGAIAETKQPPASPGGAEQALVTQKVQGGGESLVVKGEAKIENEKEYRLQSQNNLKQLALAMHNYHDVNGSFPTPAYYGQMSPQRPGPGIGVGGAGGVAPAAGAGGAGAEAAAAPAAGGAAGGAGAEAAPRDRPRGVAGRGGKAFLSWRVAVLPYLDEGELYSEFRADEPWDGPHNKRLLARMPRVFAPPGVSLKEPYLTYYQVFVGEGAGFEKRQRLRLAHIADGTSNTIMIAEAGRPVPWTKPEDLAYDPDEPLPELGGLFPDFFNVAFFDGSVHALTKTADEEMLRAAITRNGGEPINFSKLTSSKASEKSVKSTEVKRENERLRTELQKAQEELAMARFLVHEAKQVDPETAKLQRENERLEKELAQTRREIVHLRAEMERLQQGKARQRQK